MLKMVLKKVEPADSCSRAYQNRALPDDPKAASPAHSTLNLELLNPGVRHAPTCLDLMSKHRCSSADLREQTINDCKRRQCQACEAALNIS